MTACLEQGSQLFFVAGSIWKTCARVEKTGCSLPRNTLITHQNLVSLELYSHSELKELYPMDNYAFFYAINIRLKVSLLKTIHLRLSNSHFARNSVLVTTPTGLDFNIPLAKQVLWKLIQYFAESCKTGS